MCPLRMDPGLVKAYSFYIWLYTFLQTWHALNMDCGLDNNIVYMLNILILHHGYAWECPSSQEIYTETLGIKCPHVCNLLSNEMHTHLTPLSSPCISHLSIERTRERE